MRFSDCWSSVGDVTFYHIDGVCYWKRKPQPTFPGTAAQLANMDVHKRALIAWRQLEPGTQEQWNSVAVGVPSHRPPYGTRAGITGHNLFVSAYHGFARLGREHIPVPVPWMKFPVFYMDFKEASVVGGTDLMLGVRVRLEGGQEPARYRLLVKLQLTEPGRGRNGGFFRVFAAESNCTGTESDVFVLIPNYRKVWNLDLLKYQVYCRYLLLDTVTGYRCIHKSRSFTMALSQS